MKSFVLASAVALFQAVSAVAPGQAAPGTPVEGCSTSYDGTFSIGIANVTSTTTKLKRQAITLTMTLQDGVLIDSEGRTGYIASNRQFQFDLFNGQAGTIYNSGFSVCPDGTLALESSVWWGCLSGEFRNLYDESLGDQCIRLYLITTPVSGTGPIPGATTVTGGSSSNGGNSGNGGNGNNGGSSGSGSGSGSGNGNGNGNDGDDNTSTVVATRTRDTHNPTATGHATSKTAHNSVSTTKAPNHTIVVAPGNGGTTRTGGGSEPTGTSNGGGDNNSSSNSSSNPNSNANGNSDAAESSPAPADGDNAASSLTSNTFLAAFAAVAYALFI